MHAEIVPVRLRRLKVKTDNTSESLLGVRAVAERLDVSIRTVRRLLKKRKLAYHRVGGSLRVAPADLELYLRTTRES